MSRGGGDASPCRDDPERTNESFDTATHCRTVAPLKYQRSSTKSPCEESFTTATTTTIIIFIFITIINIIIIIIYGRV